MAVLTPLAFIFDGLARRLNQRRTGQGWWPWVEGRVGHHLRIMCVKVPVGGPVADGVAALAPYGTPVIFLGTAGGIAGGLRLGGVFWASTASAGGMAPHAARWSGRIPVAACGPVLTVDALLEENNAFIEDARGAGYIGVDQEVAHVYRTAALFGLDRLALLMVADLPLEHPFWRLSAEELRLGDSVGHLIDACISVAAGG